MASIVIIDSYNEAGNKFLKLLNGEAGRRLSVGSGWTSLAVGFRMMATQEGAGNVTGSPKFTFGLSSGPNTPWSNPANAIGIYHNTPQWVDSAPDADGQGHYVGDTANYVASAKNGASIRTTSSNIRTLVQEYYPNDRGTARYLKTTVFNIIKASPNWTVGLVTETAAGGNFDVGHRTTRQLITALEQMSQDGVLNSLGTSQYGSGSSSLSAVMVAESTYGYLDSVFFSWDRSNPAGIAISDVFVAKWA